MAECTCGVPSSARNLRRLFKEQAPIPVDASDEEVIQCEERPSPNGADIAREAVDILEPLEPELQEKMARDGQCATHIIHMGKALRVLREVLNPARSWIASPPIDMKFPFEQSDVYKISDEVCRLFCTLRGE